MPVRELSGNEEDHIQVNKTEKKQKLLNTSGCCINGYFFNQSRFCEHMVHRLADQLITEFTIFGNFWKMSRNVCVTFGQYSENLRKWGQNGQKYSENRQQQ